MDRGEVDEMRRVSSPKLVNALIVVADHREIAVFHQQADDFVLDGVGILKLIHQDVIKNLLIVLSDVGKFLQQIAGEEQNVIEIDRVALFE